MSPVERLTFEALTTRRETLCEVVSGRPSDHEIFCQLPVEESGEATCFSARACRLDLSGGDPDLSGLSLGGDGSSSRISVSQSLWSKSMGTALAPVRSSFPNLSATAVHASALSRPVSKVLTLITGHAQLVCTVRNEDPEAVPTQWSEG